MRLEENWAVDTARIRAFLQKQADVCEDCGLFYFRSCTIRLVALQAQVMGKWPLARTQVIFAGDDDDVDEIRRRIFLRFLSAGG